MAKHVVAERGLSIRVVCAAFGISETCYRYQAKASEKMHRLPIAVSTGCKLKHRVPTEIWYTKLATMAGFWIIGHSDSRLLQNAESFKNRSSKTLIRNQNYTQ